MAASFPEPYWRDLRGTHYSLNGFRPEWREVKPGRQEYVDEWGNTWARVDKTSKGEVARGALEDWAGLDRLVLPDLANPDTHACAPLRRPDRPHFVQAAARVPL